jgi:hypothetical protein
VGPKLAPPLYFPYHRYWTERMATPSSKITYDDFDYTIKDTDKQFHCYHCSHYRAKGCKGLLKINKQTGAIVQAGLEQVAFSGINSINAHVLHIRLQVSVGRCMIQWSLQGRGQFGTRYICYQDLSCNC